MPELLGGIWSAEQSYGMHSHRFTTLPGVKVLLLLQNGANKEAIQTHPDRQSWGTPLIWAASQGCLYTLRLLLEHGANVNASDEGGWTPLHRSAANGHDGCLQESCWPLVLFLRNCELQPCVHGSAACFSQRTPTRPSAATSVGVDTRDPLDSLAVIMRNLLPNILRTWRKTAVCTC